MLKEGDTQSVKKFNLENEFPVYATEESCHEISTQPCFCVFDWPVPK